MRQTWIVCVLLAACGGSNGGSNGDDDNGMPDAAGTMSDDGPCAPNALRCNGDVVEQCNADGTMWVPQMTCTTFCADNACALDGLDIASDQNLDGIIHVKGAVTIHNGATVTSATGDLTIFADTITVEAGGSMTSTPTGTSPLGAGTNSTCSNCSTSPGTYSWGSALDSDVQPGSAGGISIGSMQAVAGGGGRIRLIATTINMAGQITANGAAGQADPQSCFFPGAGGSGGGILVYADDLTVSGLISAAGGALAIEKAGCTQFQSSAGGPGRVKLLFGSKHDITGTVTGTLTQGLAPPLPLTSTSHPDPTAVYNDGFLSLDIAWPKPFASSMGYYVLLDTTPTHPPTAANGKFQSAEKVSFTANDISDGDNYIHVVTVDSMSNIGTIESTYHVQINTQPPAMNSPSHPTQTAFVDNTNPFFQWSYPQGDANVSAVYYVLDHFGTTVPALTDTMLPATQKQLQESGVDAGVWALHVITADKQGRLTKVAGNYRVNIGADPGSSTIMGTVVDGASQPVVGATVTVNKGLFGLGASGGTVSTTSGGGFMFPANSISAGMWEVEVSLAARNATKNVTVMAGTTATAAITLP
jgi:hypothetical protein